MKETKATLTDHEVFVEHINDLITNGKREVVGVVTTQYDTDDDISSIKIKLAPVSEDES